MSPLTGARAPYSLQPIAFPLPALAALAGRAPLGGPREVALACFMAGRLVVDAIADGPPLSADQLRSRAQGAKHWLGAAAIPAPVRVALVRLAEASGTGQKMAMKTALDSVMTVTANQLESGARLELSRLAQVLAE